MIIKTIKLRSDQSKLFFKKYNKPVIIGIFVFNINGIEVLKKRNKI
jgi:hypothetical protein